MKHFLLKFNHGVEIGARLAYLGHYDATGDRKIKKIASEEFEHREVLRQILAYYGETPSRIINFLFTFVGSTIGNLCLFCPFFMLDFVARTMETFAVINYSYLATLYPDYSSTFREMAKTELAHETYFKRRKCI